MGLFFFDWRPYKTLWSNPRRVVEYVSSLTLLSSKAGFWGLFWRCDGVCVVRGIVFPLFAWRRRLNRLHSLYDLEGGAVGSVPSSFVWVCDSDLFVKNFYSASLWLLYVVARSTSSSLTIPDKVSSLMLAISISNSYNPSGIRMFISFVCCLCLFICLTS